MQKQKNSTFVLRQRDASQSLDRFGVRSYQTLVKDEVVLTPPISHQQKLIDAVNNILKRKTSDSERE